jgi:hypothetical protein
MASFPALAPATRRYTLGSYPVTVPSAFPGGGPRFRHGQINVGHQLELGFTHLTQAETRLIRDHYRAQQGGFLPFALSAEAWAGHASSTDVVASGLQWKYLGQPEETQKSGGLVDVSLTLISVY